MLYHPPFGLPRVPHTIFTWKPGASMSRALISGTRIKPVFHPPFRLPHLPHTLFTWELELPCPAHLSPGEGKRKNPPLVVVPGDDEQRTRLGTKQHQRERRYENDRMSQGDRRYRNDKTAEKDGRYESAWPPFNDMPGSNESDTAPRTKSKMRDDTRVVTRTLFKDLPGSIKARNVRGPKAIDKQGQYSRKEAAKRWRRSYACRHDADAEANRFCSIQCAYLSIEMQGIEGITQEQECATGSMRYERNIFDFDNIRETPWPSHTISERKQSIGCRGLTGLRYEAFHLRATSYRTGPNMGTYPTIQSTLGSHFRAAFNVRVPTDSHN
ncbi:hypothetical protein NA57DRAFT_56674 [Rhizodiscina lignyota]|uniref:Uncharacterized protein n=1 Tax=Rhizodiscina lignyota TaxID=1504668 RepID=A0A9P4IDW8_9PEZI|nr:hypothetical protein NA57DRAFT_56674 [Rhizodiscina lignyota]